MRFSFKFDPGAGPPLGFSEHAGRDGEKVLVTVSGSLTSDDGERLLDRLGSVSDLLLSKAPPSLGRIVEAQIEHLVALLHRDGLVEVWINEPAVLLKAKAKRNVAAGDPILVEDFAGIAEMKFAGIEIPDDVGFIVILSVGWRKALAFDFTPLHQAAAATPRNLTHALAGLYSYLLFRNRFLLTTEDWDRLLAQGWFPFNALPFDLVEAMIHQLRAGWQVDELLPKFTASVRSRLPVLRGTIETSPLFERHRRLLLDALEAFEAGKYALAVNGIYPRSRVYFESTTPSTGRERRMRGSSRRQLAESRSRTLSVCHCPRG